VMKMEKKKIAILCGFLLSVVVLFFVVSSIMNASKSIDIQLEKEYEDIIYVSDKAEFLLVLKDEKVTNILFLNEEAKKSLADKKIEKKKIEEAVESIIDHLKNDNLLTDTKDIEAKSLKQSSSYQKVISSLNKNLVIYGIDKEVVNGNFTLDVVLDKYHLEDKKDEKENIETLYQYSRRK